MVSPLRGMSTRTERPRAIELVKRRELAALRSLLRDAPEEADLQDASTGMTALHVAAAANLPEFVTELLRVCNPTILDCEGRSAATVADLNHQNEGLIQVLGEATARALEAEDNGAPRVVHLRPKEP